VDTSIFDRLSAGVLTAGAGETQSLAEAFARALPADSVVALHGDLGAGKTTWVQGMARAFGVDEAVTSPTFTIYTLHRGSNRLLAHIDAYRLDRAEQMEDLLLEDFLTSPWCVAVEWPEKVGSWLPAGAWHLDLAIETAGRHRIRLTRSPPAPSTGA
jgi:tRNA threonylcarbamoyladenosine biosynthesis protein TsaE